MFRNGSFTVEFLTNDCITKNLRMMKNGNLMIKRTAKFIFSGSMKASGGKSISTGNTTTGQTSNPTITFLCQVK